MKYLFSSIAIALLLSLAIVSIHAQESKATLKSLAFISGCWEMKVPGRKTVIAEQWMAPAGDAMLGMNRTLTSGKLSGFEYLRIIQKGDSLFYIALPSENDTPTSFELKSFKKDEVIFENLGNDFPQTISYAMAGPGKMTAVVEGLGTERPKRRRVEFPMVRVKCP